MHLPSAHARVVETGQGVERMEMASAIKVWSVADLADLPDDGSRYEVIDGELHVTPAPSFDHQRAILRLAELLAPYVRRERLGDVLVAPADVTFSERRGVQPDLFVAPLVDGRKPHSFAEARRLLLAVETVSPSTARWDRVTKRNLYRDEGVSEYWIVDLDARVIERSTPASNAVEVISEKLIWNPDGAAEHLEVDVEEYFRAVLDD
jgi:Uma2 family endonuclease